jgi:hypothetical protein
MSWIRLIESPHFVRTQFSPVDYQDPDALTVSCSPDPESKPNAPPSIKGNYNGPAPWLPDMIHDYEITVKAYDQNGKVIGVGKKVKTFLFGPVENARILEPTDD